MARKNNEISFIFKILQKKQNKHRTLKFTQDFLLLDNSSDNLALKTKAFCTGAWEVYSHSVKVPGSVCGKGVGRNSIKCTKCTKWVHKRSFGSQEVLKWL